MRISLTASVVEETTKRVLLLLFEVELLLEMKELCKTEEDHPVLDSNSLEFSESLGAIPKVGG